MRASDLIGLDVVNRTGKPIGIVTDLRCRLDGPRRGGLPLPRLSAVVVSHGHTASLLGYDRREQQGPWLVRVIVRWIHRDMQVVPWNQIKLQETRLVADVD